MVERPIVFSGDMMRRLLAGQKTQTRRIVTQPDAPDLADLARRRYGPVGARLWVRETWCRLDDQPCAGGWVGGLTGYAYAADDVEFYGEWSDPDRVDATDIRWRSSRYMPRAASRLTLEVTGLRVERLHDITEGDAIDEGMLGVGDAWLRAHFPDYMRELDRVVAHNAELTARGEHFGHTRPPLGPTPRERYARLWEDLHGPGAWERNPLVFVIRFQPCPPTPRPARGHP